MPKNESPPVKSTDKANKTHYDVGVMVRKIIEEIGNIV